MLDHKVAVKQLPIRPLSLFLIKSEVKEYDSALRSNQRRVERYALREDVPFKGAVFLGMQGRATPDWLEFLEQGTTTSLQKLFNASSGGVLFVRASRRLFALTFGRGRHLLNPEAIERWFGLRAAINAVNGNLLRSLDAKIVQEKTLLMRRQVSAGAAISAFDVDAEVELLSSITGTPGDEELGTSISGSDALQLSPRAQFASLGKYCARALRLSKATAYRDAGFEFVDHLRIVRDPQVVSELDAALVARLQQGDVNGIHLAPPEVLDWEDVEGFAFSRKGDLHAELDMVALLASLRGGNPPDAKMLARKRIFWHSKQASGLPRSWSAYRCIAAEHDDGLRRLILCAGSWYEVEQSFVKLIAGRLERLREAQLGLPSSLVGEKEQDYLKRVASSDGPYLFDRRLVKFGGSPIEVCDLYTARKQFIHVKRWTASATLSHLFAQGLVSAQAFLADEDFRNRMRVEFVKVARHLGAHIPTSRPVPQQYDVIYAIMKPGSARGWRHTLPFFSQLHLTRSAQQLKMLGFNVKIERV